MANNIPVRWGYIISAQENVLKKMFVLKSTHTTSFASSIIYLFWYESVTPIPRFPEGWGGRVVKWTNPAFIEKNIDMCLNPQLQVSIELNEPVELTFALRYLNFFTKVCTASNLPNYTHSTSITLFLKHITLVGSQKIL